MIQGLVLLREHRERRVVAHRAHRLLAGERHGQQLELEVLLRVAEGLLPVEQRDGGLERRRLLGLDLVELHANALDPFGIGLRGRERLLQLLVIDDAAFLQVDEEHLARLQAPLLDDAVLGHGQAAALRAHDDKVILGDDVARGPQPVAIERRADAQAVGEGDRGGPVPRLHHGRVVLVERAPARVHQRVVFPRLRDHHHHRVRDRVAAHDEQLERIVEGGRVRLAVVDQRPDLAEVRAEHGARNRALPRADPIHVAAHRVDLAVVADHAERVREIP